MGGSEGWASLACCSPRGCKESDTTWQLNNKTLEYYLALKKNKKKILTDTTIWMNREDTMLPEIGWQQKDKSCVIPLT